MPNKQVAQPPKWIGRSKTVWGGIMMMVPIIIGLGASAGLWDTTIVEDAELDRIKDFGLDLIGFIGFAWMAFGRKKAQEAVTLLPFRPGNKPVAIPFRKAA